MELRFSLALSLSITEVQTIIMIMMMARGCSVSGLEVVRFSWNVTVFGDERF